jgi:LuxR family maltose regulon positive regulatory protein
LHLYHGYDYSMTMPLLHTKLMPPRIHSTIIPREDLSQRLDEGLSRQLTLVSAPTGFGKTTLVSQWLAERKLPTAWVALDENDNDPVRFWTYVVSALRTLDAEIGKAALAALSNSQIPSFQTVLTSLINELAGNANSCVLVLEDYHAITNPEIQSAVEFLLQHKPDTLHLVVISRSEPDLPLGILRARDELVEITAADLRFDRAETESFLRETLKSEMPPSAVEKLLERTEGWVAGLRLAALSLQNKNGEATSQVIESFSGGHRFVADYLIREVFANQPENVQSFLLKTCFLNRLTGALCDSITGAPFDTLRAASDGESVLEQLERENLFLVQLEHGRGRTWYRYSPLFAESIQSLARQRLGADGVQSIFQKASNWYAGQHLFGDAIEMALAAEQFERALELIETFIEIYNLNELHTLTRWLERIPQSLTMEHPAICMAYAQVILFSSDRYAPATAARIEPYLQAAERVWTAAGNDAKVGTVLALRGMMLLWQGEFQKSLVAVYAALEKMPESEVFWRGVTLLNAAGGELYAGRMLSAQDKILEARALLGASQNIFGLLAASGLLSDVFYAQGDLELCTQLCEQVMVDAVGDESMLDDQGNARLNLANVTYEQNDLEAAERHAAEALELGQRRANELMQAQAAGRLALIRAAKGEILQARDDLKALMAQTKSLLGQTEIRTFEALLAVRAGDAPGPWLLSNPEALPAQREREMFILARWQINEGQPEKALALLQPAVKDAAEHGRMRSQVEALCLIALAQHSAGDLSAAAEALVQALEIGHEKGFRRLFLDENARMAALLREILPALTPSTALRATLKLYTTTLLHLFSPEMVSAQSADSGSLALVEPLSQQEIRVLKLLVAGLSNGEIARELIVSTNTVKTHVKSIYRKLDINSREEARVVVKELKLL